MNSAVSGMSCMKGDPLKGEIDALLERLPELSWKLQSVSPLRVHAYAPRGLFRSRFPETSVVYLQEIQSDLDSLARYHPASQQRILVARKIHDKIDALVRVCTWERNDQQSMNRFADSIYHKLATRRQVTDHIEQQLAILQEQKNALNAQLIKTEDIEKQLAIQGELGRLERLVTELSSKQQSGGAF